MKEKYLVRINEGPWKEVKRPEYEKHLEGSGVAFQKNKPLAGLTFQNGYLSGKVSVIREDKKQKPASKS